MGASVLPNGSALEAGDAPVCLYGWVVPSLAMGPWVSRRRVLSFMCLCVSAHPRGCVCCVACVLEHCAAKGQCVCLGYRASLWEGVVKLCGEVVCPRGP